MDHKSKAAALVAQMSLEEKAALCSGEDFWHMKALPRLGLEEKLLLTDGPHGLRKQTEGADQLGINDSLPATCFPAECATACSFDRDLLREIGSAIGQECCRENVAVVLGPGANIKRSPLCGRNFEYFSEDPLVAGELAAAFIDGVQSQNVGTSLKHFAANNQETRRMTMESVMDERALREIYLAAFETAVKKAQPWTVMCSYNKLLGLYAGDNRRLLTDILRDEWGFKGLVVSDWGAVNDRVAGVGAGMDLEMPAVSRANDLLVADAVRSGKLSEKELDENACRVAELMLKARKRGGADFSFDAHHALARKAAASSAVLLKNEGKLLPLSAQGSLAVIGVFAEKPRYQGAGSSKINPYQVDSALAELSAAGISYEYAPGYDPDRDEIDHALIEAACKTAHGKDAAIIFAGLPARYESEGFDRTGIDMPKNQSLLIERVAAANPNTAVVLMCGSVVAVPWEKNVKAILLSYLGGEAACGAAVDLLLGKVNPSGKLAESWCNKLSDNPSFAYFPGYMRSVEYRESVFVGYRYYDTSKQKVRYPFGYGLSYTNFVYSDLTVDKSELTDGQTLTVSFNVTNTGKVRGGETVQLYVAPKIEGGIFRPAQELRGFEKLWLEAGETKSVAMSLTSRAFAYYNVDVQDWAVENGEYEIRIGASSRDIRLSQRVKLSALSPVQAPDYRKSAGCYYELEKGIANVPDAAFEALLGKKIPPRELQKGDKHTVNSTMQEIQNRALGRKLYSLIIKKSSAQFGGDKDMQLMMENMLADAPLRMLLMTGGSAITPRRLEGLVALLNGEYISGIKKLLGK